MNYAIIKLAGQQHRVSEGDTIVVDRQDATDLTVSEVLLVRQDKDLKIGAPFVEKATVALKKVSDQRGEKIRVFKYKAKSRYRRTQGHRQEESVLRVEKISA
jgi:large subunit ribosomal protein L21